MDKKEFVKRIYSLECGQNFFVDDAEMWTRVPGGWIVTQNSLSLENRQGLTSVFVPWDNEFQPAN